MQNAFLAYLLLGAFAGTLAGLLGVGGGLVIVPVLASIYLAQGVSEEYLMHLALGTSLATIIFTSLSSVYAHHRRGAVRWGVFASLTPGILLGALCGALLAHQLPSRNLSLLFAIFELSVAAQLWFGARPHASRTLPGVVGLSGAGGVIGTISAIVGIGGGTMTVPFLLWCNVPMREAVATSAAVGLPIALSGAAGYLFSGLGVAGLPEQSLGYIHLPALLGICLTSMLFAPLGARLAHSLPAARLKRLFALFLLLLGLRMLLG